MKWIWLFCLFVFCTGCNSNGEKDKFIAAFEHQDTYQLKSEAVILEESELYFSSMFKMIVVDSLILISELKDPDYEMKMVDLKTSRIYNFGRRGNGPNDIMSQGAEFSVDHDNKRLYVIDRNNILVYNTDSLKNNAFSPEEKLLINLKEDKFLQSVFSKNKIIGSNMIGKPFGIYNFETNTISKKDSPNKKLLSDGVLNNQMFFVNHPTNDLIAYFHYKSGINGIISLGSEKVTLAENFYWANNNKEVKSGNETKIYHDEKEINGFINATADEHYIYALYSGKRMNVTSMDELTKTYTSKYVYVFDWEGNPMERYELDQEVRSIAIDHKAKILYAASYKNEPNLIRYNLNLK